VIPWCTRCQTPLSNNELAQPGAYQKAKDPSVFVKFPLYGSHPKKHGREYFLVWTTTPWTLPGNVAIAVNPKVAYTKFKVGDEFLWSLTPPPHPPGSPAPTVVEKVAGAKLAGLRYEPLYPTTKPVKAMYRILAGDFVSTEEGTGFVHISPAFGDDDFTLIRGENQKLSEKEKIPVLITVDDRGIMKSGFPGVGKFLKEADKDVLSDLLARGLLFKEEKIEHEYPFCWRCNTPLIYLARLTWFIEMSKLKQEMLKVNKTINWIPGHIREGRFGEWLKEGKDWSISRERYWGTPLPIWEGEKCEHRFVAGSFDELNKYRYHGNQFFLVRHGEGEHNVKRTLSCMPEGQHPPRLTKRGKEQAEAVAERLKQEKVNLIVSSPNRRARETAQIIAKATKAKVIVDSRIQEIGFGTFNGGTEARYKSFFATFIERFSKRPPGGEHWGDVRQRMVQTMVDIDRKFSGKRIAIVSHGDPLWLLEGAAKGVSDAGMAKVPYIEVGEWREFSLPNWPFSRSGEVDFHRPFVDEIFLRCSECGGRMRRVREVADVWFDSGAMPFAEWHYPFENKEMVDRHKHFPADYIVEGVDQTRGWFYSLLAISTLLKKGISYKNVISMGLVLDKHGQKMSKSKGNVVEPMALIGTHGADTLRWYFFTINDPADSKKFDEEDLKKAFRRIFLVIWNTYVFLETYQGERHQPIEALDEWIEARFSETATRVSKYLDRFSVGEAAREIELFVEDLSRWYVRRSRKNVSPKVLREILIGLSKLMAPFVPFFSEALYQSLVTSEKQKVKSVHLEDWKFLKTDAHDRRILTGMAEVRRLASLALAAREKAGIKVRQPLAMLKVKSQKLKVRNNGELIQLLKDEVNVKTVTYASKLATEVELDMVITPELYAEGMAREFSRAIQDLRKGGGYKVGDMVEVAIRTTPKLALALRSVEELVKKAVGAVRISIHETQIPEGRWSAQTETKVDGEPTWIGIKDA
ncbi:MAG: class I tRNA ligase family protein, partial [Patescibacteria group bacterium]